MEKTIFEILGISTKEDTWSNALKYLMEKNDDFTRDLLEAIFGNTRFENTIPLKFELRPKIENIGHPDLVIVNRGDSAWIVVLENKLFAGEGYKQTDRYAKKSIIASHYKLDKVGPYFVFLHLVPGQKAESKEYISFCWEDVIPLLEKHNFKDYSKIIADDMLCLLKYFYSLKNIQGSVREILYKAGENPLNGKFLIFQSIMKKTEDKLNKKNGKAFKTSGSWFGLGNHAYFGCRFIKDAWHTKNVEFDKDVKEWPSENYNIHIEPQMEGWRNDLITLKVHFESNPYMKKKQLENIAKKNSEVKKRLEKYNNLRNRFIKSFHEGIPETSWKANNYYLQIASSVL